MVEVPSIAFQTGEHIRFSGAKVTVFVGSQIVTLLRDDIPNIPMPGHWDLPGGGREDDESPWQCAMRECFEETGICLRDEDLLWGRLHETERQANWFFVAVVEPVRSRGMALGDEGQELRLMSVDDYLVHPKAIPNFQKRLADWISGSDVAPELS